MTRRRGMSRRRFLVLSGSFGASIVSGCVAPGGWFDSAERSRPPAERLVGLLRHRSSARNVGEAYLESTPSEAAVDRLVEAILAGLEDDAGALRRTRAELHDQIARRVEQDFAEEATVCLRGWILSRTEARMCALAALS